MTLQMDVHQGVLEAHRICVAPALETAVIREEDRVNDASLAVAQLHALDEYADGGTEQSERNGSVLAADRP